MFQGFSPETIDFLWGIRFNNNRDWFALHKQEYQSTLYEPMKSLSAEVGAAFADVDGLRVHLSRIYRDMRMHPTTFYKDSLWFCLRRDGSPWLERPCLCFEVRPEGYRYGFLYAYPKTDDAVALRTKMTDHADEFLALVGKAERDSGVKLGGDRYKRPKPCPDERLAPYFGLKNFIAIRDCPPDERLYSPGLADEVRRVLLAWRPVCRFFMDL